LAIGEPVAAKLLLLRDAVLNLLHPVGPDLLLLSHPVLLNLLALSDTVLLDLLTLSDAVLLNLLALSHSILLNLLTLGHAVLLDLLTLGEAVLDLLTRLHPLSTHLSLLHSLRTRLDPLGAHCLNPLDPLRALDRCHALLALDARRRKRLTLHARSAELLDTLGALRRSVGLGALASAAAPALGNCKRGLTAMAAATAVGPRACRGCDRERGNAGCEKYPGH
jgi:hypothetical protein